MQTLLQRVSRAAVQIEGHPVAAIQQGLLLFVGVERGDQDQDARSTARKIASLRVFPGRTPLDRDVREVGGECLVVSQFTLAGSIRKGRRPSFDAAADPGEAERLYLQVAAELEQQGVPVRTGRFGAMMEVELLNWGPVTLMVVSRGGSIQ